MLKVAVLVSGGGTNLQAILDAIDSGRITNAEVSLVISNNPNAYALERAKNHGIEAVCISPKEFENREEFHKALLKKLQESGAKLIVLAGYLVLYFVLRIIDGAASYYMSSIGHIMGVHIETDMRCNSTYDRGGISK